jgi:hypothetical protein
MPTPDAHGITPISQRYHYPHVPPQRRAQLITEEYEYLAPFKYDNLTVTRYTLRSREGHGVELGMVNQHVDAQGDAHDYDGDHLVLREEHPIVRVAVIGSACTPPGWVQLECDVVPGWRNDYEVATASPARFRINDLWGMHLRVDALYTSTPEVQARINRTGQPSAYEPVPPRTGELYPSTRAHPLYHKSHYRENPLAGMSCAIFEIPPSRSVTIQAGSQIPGWVSDNYPGDHHYSIRVIRTTVQLRREDA